MDIEKESHIIIVMVLQKGHRVVIGLILTKVLNTFTIITVLYLWVEPHWGHAYSVCF